MDIFSRLSDAEARYNDINAQLSSGEMAGNSDEISRLLKEQGELDPIVSAYNEYKSFRESEREAKEIIENEKDKEIVELAKEEYAEAGKEIERLE